MQQWAADPEADDQAREQEESEKDRNIEQDDEETLQRMRAMDDWKDGKLIHIFLKNYSFPC